VTIQRNTQATLRDRRFIGSKAVHRVMLIFQDLEASIQSARIRTDVNEMMTLLVKSWQYNFHCHQGAFHEGLVLILLSFKYDMFKPFLQICDLTNRVNDDAVCGVVFPNSSEPAEPTRRKH
jgi:hypothetical protein